MFKTSYNLNIWQFFSFNKIKNIELINKLFLQMQDFVFLYASLCPHFLPQQPFLVLLTTQLAAVVHMSLIINKKNCAIYEPNWVHKKFSCTVVKNSFTYIYRENRLSMQIIITYGRYFSVWILCKIFVTFCWTLELCLRHFWTGHIKTKMFPSSVIVSRVKICHWYASVRFWGHPGGCRWYFTKGGFIRVLN